MDVTSVQNLIDVRNQLDRYASPEVVEWHFACINNRWTKRALVSAGFGYPTPQLREDGHFQRWKPVYSVAEFGAMDSAAAAAEWRDQNMSAPRRPSARDVEAIAANKGGDATADQIGSRHTEGSSDEDSLEKQLSASKAYGTMQSARQAVVHSVNRPLFHMDLTSALQSAIGSAKRKEALEQEGGLRGGEI